MKFTVYAVRRNGEFFNRNGWFVPFSKNTLFFLSTGDAFECLRRQSLMEDGNYEVVKFTMEATEVKAWKDDGR